MKYSMRYQLLLSTALAVIITTQILEMRHSFAAAAKYKNKVAATSSCSIQHDIKGFEVSWNKVVLGIASLLKQNKTVNNLNKSNFLVLAGGGAPDHNEIALEKNVLYFQRTLQQLGYDQKDASVYFANGNDGKATIRYLDDKGNEKFKVPSIPYLIGASTFSNLQNWVQQASKVPNQPILMYFTGHGIANERDLNNNSLTLWNRQLMSVKQFSTMLDKMPQQIPVAVVMAQCYSGSFANFIYQGGNPNHSLALQTRCGFFATIKTLPSVGCTPLVNEADYKDYSSSFFAGLSGKNRIGQSVASADYNKDNKVSYAEAHAFAKVDEQTMDLPISTSESWLQEQATTKDVRKVLQQPISEIIKTARPEQKYVVNSIVKMFNWNINKSFGDSYNQSDDKYNTEEKLAYIKRLEMQLIDIDMERNIRKSNNQQQIAILDKLLKCENSAP
jgi:hypothetical protein